MLAIILGLGGITAGIVFYTDYFVNKPIPSILVSEDSPSASADNNVEAVLDPIETASADFADTVSAVTENGGISPNTQGNVDAVSSATSVNGNDSGAANSDVDAVSSASVAQGEDDEYYDDDDDDDDDDD